jgi:hypothetical protein
VQVAGGRCDCKTLSHTPNNPAGIQFYFPWPVVVCRANPCGRREDEGTYSLRPIAAAAAAFPKFIPVLKASGSLIPGLARVHLRQKSSRCIAKGFQVSIPFCRQDRLSSWVRRTRTYGKEIRKCPKTQWRNPK